MSGFRSEELISLTDLFFILAIAATLLSVVYVLLRKMRPGVLRQLDKQFSQKIELIEKRHIPYLGQVFIISVCKEQFVVVQAKTGVTIAPLQKIATVDAEQPDLKSL
jgi:flagellar biogenesis protein FliO